jgi:hypothetical protein
MVKQICVVSVLFFRRLDSQQWNIADRHLKSYSYFSINSCGGIADVNSPALGGLTPATDMSRGQACLPAGLSAAGGINFIGYREGLTTSSWLTNLDEVTEHKELFHQY